MSLRDIARGAMPAAALAAVQRVHGMRSIGVPASLSRGLSPRWTEWVEWSQLLTLPRAMKTGPAVVVDAGANKGRWAEAVLELLRPARLIAIEPTPDSFELLQRRVQRWPSVDLHHMALSDHEGTTTLRLFNRPEFNSLLAPVPQTAHDYSLGGKEALEPSRTVEVPVTTLDRLLGDDLEVGLLKVDVQGSELAVLKGAARTLSRTALVMLEANFVHHYEGDSLFPDLHAHMTERGFVLYRFGRNHAEGRTGRLLWADVIYARPEIIGACPA